MRVRKIHEMELIAGFGAAFLITTGIIVVKVDNTSKNVKYIRRKQSELETEFQLQKDKIEEMEKLQQELVKKIDSDIETMVGLDKVKEDIVDLRAKHRETMTEIRAKAVLESKQKPKVKKRLFENLMKPKASFW